METRETVRRFGQRPEGKGTISFFSAPAPLVAQTLIEWGRKVWRKVTRFAPLPGTWDEFLGEYVTPDSRIVLVPTRGEWSALINNDRIGSLPFSELLILPERLKCRSAAFAIGDLARCRQEKRPYAAMFHYCDATQGQAEQRSIGLICDAGRWEYHETGQPLPFEEPLAGERRPQSERLTPQMLVRYAQALGIELDAGDSFYNLGQAIGLEWKWDQSPLGVLRVLGQELGVYGFLETFRGRFRSRAGMKRSRIGDNAFVPRDWDLFFSTLSFDQRRSAAIRVCRAVLAAQCPEDALLREAVDSLERETVTAEQIRAVKAALEQLEFEYDRLVGDDEGKLLHRDPVIKELYDKARAVQAVSFALEGALSDMAYEAWIALDPFDLEKISRLVGMPDKSRSS